MDSFLTHILFVSVNPPRGPECGWGVGGSAVALAGHQCRSFIPLHTGLVLTPLAKFTDLTDCGLNAACLVFSTCPSRFATLAAQFSSNSNYSSARYACAGAPPLIRGDAGLGPRLAPSEETSSEPVRACALSERWVTASLSESGEGQEEEGPVLTARCDVPSHARSPHTHTLITRRCVYPHDRQIFSPTLGDELKFFCLNGVMLLLPWCDSSFFWWPSHNV